MRVAQRRGMSRAIVALARRLAIILHRMWVDGTDFRWSKLHHRRDRCVINRAADKEINRFCLGRKMSSRGRWVA